MFQRLRVRIAWLAAIALCWGASGMLHAQQSWPVKPIRLVIPFPPGGPTDIIGRAVARELEKALGQAVVVENRAGAGGTIGAESVAKAPPDGYTLLIGTLATHGINPELQPKLGYNVLRDFHNIALLVLVQNFLVVHPSVPARSVKELVALARKHPGKLNYGSVGIGGASHLMAELLNARAGVKTVHVPYKGVSPALVALLSGEIDFFLSGLPALLPHVKSGRLRALAVTTDKRSPLAPEVPTMIESGLPDYNVSTWYVLSAPAATPREVTARVGQIIVKSLGSAEMKASLAAMGAEAIGATPEQTAEFLRREIAQWTKVIQQAGVKPE
ncbi:MAG TPA: tripartite tricarboxylate transporter substrate binding protein [Burkholderiales bacterium]|nr:tripartite tricarboxylate transporter substrate binding protein [Burkholderiales bacterium]